MTDSSNLQPFRFYTKLNLTGLTGLRASNLDELLAIMKDISGSSIYHHTHRFLQQHQYLSPEPPNDFAYWVGEVIGEKPLSENLASIDTVQFRTIRELRDKIVNEIDDYLKENPEALKRRVREGEEFHFMKSLSIIVPSQYTASNMDEFLQCLKKITIHSIYFHIFEARLRLERGTNDFSMWIETSLGNKKLADRISRLDPYTYTLESLRKTLINIIEESRRKRG